MGTPTGTVNFTDNGSTIAGCSAKTLSGGQATCAVTYSASGGNHTHISRRLLRRRQLPSSTSTRLHQNVTKANTGTALSPSVNPSVSGQTVTYTATVSASAPGAGTPTGTVPFKDGTTTISGCGTQALTNGSRHDLHGPAATSRAGG